MLVHHFSQVTSSDASIESNLKSPHFGLPIQSAQYVFCSASSIPFSIEYAAALYEELEVNSPPLNPRVVVVASPSPLRPRRAMGSPSNIGGHVIIGRRIVYNAEALPSNALHCQVCASPAITLVALFWCVCYYLIQLGSCWICTIVIHVPLCIVFCRIGLLGPLMIPCHLHHLFAVRRRCQRLSRQLTSSK